MCGILFLEQRDPGQISEDRFRAALNRQRWRGPDAQRVFLEHEGRMMLGHNRLSILDPTPRADQPMLSQNGRFVITYNGEVYNHVKLREKLGGEFRTGSDTETILEGYTRYGEKIFEMLDGMFAMVILDRTTGHWVAVRDPLGIKPLHISRSASSVVIGSEPAVIADLVGATPCAEAVAEWKIIRRPVPGKSFFSGIDEIMPGTLWRSDGRSMRYWTLKPLEEPFSQEVFEARLTNSIKEHELSDVSNNALLSGGLDSAVITALSSVERVYTVGLPENNEFDGALDTARFLQRQLVRVEVSPDELHQLWTELTRLRGEPLGLPNEGLIYSVCKSMEPLEKVVLTGEGADELLFGYDRIFRWAEKNAWSGMEDFLIRYGYSEHPRPTERLLDYIDDLRYGKTLTEFLEDFFLHLHLPGLLRRMDFASMAASKEARVPFVSCAMISYMYRRPLQLRIVGHESKLPLRLLARRLGLAGALARQKIGFSATTTSTGDRYQEYAHFQNTVLEALGWQ
ncbi:MAG: asparagine synthase (glutamine-hydrolyzing) [Burkholderiales bacterium]|nr:asparagine synthase (glutamine-hydrolyzing) [Burkholderiales bacterium]